MARSTLTVLAVASLLAACAVGPDYVAPKIDLPAAFVSPAPAATAAVNPDWWRGFDDPVLNGLIEDALTNSHSLAAARARFEAAQAAAGLAWRGYLLTGGAQLQGEYGRRSSSDVPAGGGREVRSAVAGVNAAWEADVVGRVGRTVEAARADEQAEESLLRDARRVLTAEVARTYVALRGTQERLAIAQASLAAQQGTYSIVQTKLDVGRGTAFDVARAAAQVASTSAQVPTLTAEVRSHMYRLAALCGKPPGTYVEQLAVTRHLATPELGGIGEPLELLRRRPDLRAAERRVAAATARIGIATADLYPRIAVEGAAGWSAPRGSGLGDSAFGFASVLPRISWAFLDIPRVKARIQVAGAQAEEAAAVFRQQVVEALEETDRALTSYAQYRERLVHLTRQVQHAEQAVALANQRYRDGVSSFLDVLEAERTSLDARDKLVTTQLDASATYVAVYAALGG
ncbi:efflux transporter outer membrane subunit [Roseateles sp.]|uniref:efflux transporter outer membrane subunit n=1 Tax=Roseateles sp. TaxID=1971397 RepID=UPI0039EC6FF7